MTQDDFTARALVAFESVVPVTDRMREALAAALRAEWLAATPLVWGPEAPTLTDGHRAPTPSPAPVPSKAP